MPRDAEGLLPRQARFVVEYCKDFNGTQALVRAGYSKNGANRQVSAILSNPVIACAIAIRRAGLMAKLESDATASLREIQIDLTAQLRGTRYKRNIADLEDEVAELKGAAAILARDLRRRGLDPLTRAQVAGRLLEVDKRVFAHLVSLAHLRLAQERTAQRAGMRLAKMFGAFDPWRPQAKTPEDLISKVIHTARRAGIDISKKTSR